MARVYRGSAEDIVSSNRLIYANEVILSFFGRANYSYNKRYSISGAIRADGSSKFTKENRWGIFPSAAVSWDVAQESFLKRVRNVNQLKLRYSFGAAGNNRIPSGVVSQESIEKVMHKIFTGKKAELIGLNTKAFEYWKK